MKEALPKLLFLVAIIALSFSYGFLSHWAQIFPYSVLREAHIAFVALLELTEQKDIRLENLSFWDESGIERPTYKVLAPGAGEEKIFFLGNDLTYHGQSTEQPYLAWIADRKGNVLHAWKHPGEIWAPLQNRDAVGDTWRSYTIGAHLFPNGDILVSYQGTNVFPISMGLAKFDKDSNLLWKRDGFYHHWFSVDSEGKIYVPGTLIGESPFQIPDREKIITCEDAEFPYDSVVILDPNGIPLKEIDMLTAINESDLTGLLNSNRTDPAVLETCAPLHLNDAQVLSAESAKMFPAFSAGDLLLSFRSLNGIGVLDPDTELFKWFYVGASQHQHSPRYFRDNKVLMFDNLGGRKGHDTSRILAIDVGSARSEVLFPRQDRKLPSETFFSRTAGHIDVHPTDDKILAAFSLQGIVWEIDTTTGEVLWEFKNTHTIDGKPGRVDVYVAKYVDNISFPMNSGNLE